ncbi:MAG: hypothetical protein WD042_08910 [Phycisphaeraceae bacterium]
MKHFQKIAFGTREAKGSEVIIMPLAAGPRVGVWAYRQSTRIAADGQSKTPDPFSSPHEVSPSLPGMVVGAVHRVCCATVLDWQLAVIQNFKMIHYQIPEEP